MKNSKFTQFNLFLKKIKNFFFKNKKSTAIFIVLVMVGIFFITKPLFADDGPLIANALADLGATIFQKFTKFVLSLIIFLFKFFLNLSKYNDYVNTNIVIVGWTLVRDVANMFFVVIFLVIAFGTILGLENYQWNKLLGKLIFAAIFINFSKTICGLFIDVAYVFSLTFLNAIVNTADTNLLNTVSMGKLNRVDADSTDGINKADLLVSSAVAFMFSVILLLTIGAYTIIMLLRVVVLWILIILSPLAFIMQVMPQTQEYAKQWWNKFTKQVLVLPVMVFFLWLTFATMSGGKVADELDVSVSGSLASTNGTLAEITRFDNLANFFVPIAMLIVGLTLVGQMGVVGGGLTSKALDFGKKVATIATGYAAGRKLAGGVLKGTKFLGKKAAMNVPIIGGKAWVRRGQALSGLGKIGLSKFAQLRDKGAKKLEESSKERATLKDSLRKGEITQEQYDEKIQAMGHNGALSAVGRFGKRLFAGRIESGGRADKRAKNWQTAAESEKKIEEAGYSLSSTLGGRLKTYNEARAQVEEKKQKDKATEKVDKWITALNKQATAELSAAQQGVESAQNKADELSQSETVRDNKAAAKENLDKAMAGQVEKNQAVVKVEGEIKVAEEQLNGINGEMDEKMVELIINSGEDTYKKGFASLFDSLSEEDQKNVTDKVGSWAAYDGVEGYTGDELTKQRGEAIKQLLGEGGIKGNNKFNSGIRSLFLGKVAEGTISADDELVNQAKVDKEAETQINETIDKKKKELENATKSLKQYNEEVVAPAQAEYDKWTPAGVEAQKLELKGAIKELEVETQAMAAAEAELGRLSVDTTTVGTPEQIKAAKDEVERLDLDENATEEDKQVALEKLDELFSSISVKDKIAQQESIINDENATNEQKQAAKDELDRLTMTTVGTPKEIKAAQAEVKRLNEDPKATDEQKQAAQAELDRLNISVKVEDKIKQLREEIQTPAEKRAAAEAELGRLTISTIGTPEEIATAQAKVDGLNTNESATEEDKQAAQAELGRLNTSKKDEIERLKAIISDKKATDEQKQAAKDELDRLTMTTVGTPKEIKAAQAEVKRLNEDPKATDEQKQAAQAELDRLNISVKVEDKIKQLREEIQTPAEKRAAAQAKLGELSSTLGTPEEIKAAQAEIAAAKDKVEKVLKKNPALQAVVASKKAAVAAEERSASEKALSNLVDTTEMGSKLIEALNKAEFGKKWADDFSKNIKTQKLSKTFDKAVKEMEKVYSDWQKTGSGDFSKLQQLVNQVADKNIFLKASFEAQKAEETTSEHTQLGEKMKNWAADLIINIPRGGRTNSTVMTSMMEQSVREFSSYDRASGSKQAVKNIFTILQKRKNGEELNLEDRRKSMGAWLKIDSESWNDDFFDAMIQMIQAKRNGQLSGQDLSIATEMDLFLSNANIKYGKDEKTGKWKIDKDYDRHFSSMMQNLATTGGDFQFALAHEAVSKKQEEEYNRTGKKQDYWEIAASMGKLQTLEKGYDENQDYIQVAAVEFKKNALKNGHAESGLNQEFDISRGIYRFNTALEAEAGMITEMSKMTQAQLLQFQKHSFGAVDMNTGLMGSINRNMFDAITKNLKDVLELRNMNPRSLLQLMGYSEKEQVDTSGGIVHLGGQTMREKFTKEDGTLDKIALDNHMMKDILLNEVLGNARGFGLLVKRLFNVDANKMATGKFTIQLASGTKMEGISGIKAKVEEIGAGGLGVSQKEFGQILKQLESIAKDWEHGHVLTSFGSSSRKDALSDE